MDNETRDARSGVAAAPPPSRVVAAPHSETRTLWLPDVWAVYVANGEDPESGDWPVSDCDEELRRLRLEGFDTVSPTDQTREFQTYRGVIGTMRAYEALRIGGDERVTRRVTLVRQQGGRLRDDATREILLDTSLTLARTESQPVERLAAQAWHDVHGDERRVARSWGDPGTPMLDPVWLYIETDDPREPLPGKDWADVAAIKSRVDERNVIARFVLKQPRDRLGITRLPAVYYRFAAFYDRDGLARCPGCDTPKRQVLDESRTGDWCGCPVFDTETAAAHPDRAPSAAARRR